MAVGSLVVHIAVKLPVIRAVLTSDLEDGTHDRPATFPTTGALTRRGLLWTTWTAASVAVLASARSTVPALRRISVLGVRDGRGPQDVPINKSARAARVTATAVAPDFVLTVTHGTTSRSLHRSELKAMQQRTASLPIACVEGWSAGATWTGVPVRDLLDLVGAPAGSHVLVRSLQPSGPYRTTLLQGNFTDDHDTLLALQLNGNELSIDHGFPCRLIAPNRPGVLQTKWVRRIEVTA